jgi:hypothetical protein
LAQIRIASFQASKSASLERFGAGDLAERNRRHYRADCFPAMNAFPLPRPFLLKDASACGPYGIATIRLPNSIGRQGIGARLIGPSGRFCADFQDYQGLELLEVLGKTEFQDRCLKPLGHPSLRTNSILSYRWPEKSERTSVSLGLGWAKMDGPGHRAFRNRRRRFGSADQSSSRPRRPTKSWPAQARLV